MCFKSLCGLCLYNPQYKDNLKFDPFFYYFFFIIKGQWMDLLNDQAFPPHLALRQTE